MPGKGAVSEMNSKDKMSKSREDEEPPNKPATPSENAKGSTIASRPQRKTTTEETSNHRVARFYFNIIALGFQWTSYDFFELCA
jgi:hypothetical protein